MDPGSCSLWVHAHTHTHTHAQPRWFNYLLTTDNQKLSFFRQWRPVSADEGSQWFTLFILTRSRVSVLPGALSLLENTHAVLFSVARVRLNAPFPSLWDLRGGQSKSRSAACITVTYQTMMAFKAPWGQTVLIVWRYKEEAEYSVCKCEHLLVFLDFRDIEHLNMALGELWFQDIFWTKPVTNQYENNCLLQL